MQAKLTRILAVAAAAGLLAGCGGGSDRLSKAEYEQRIQADGRDAREAVTRASSSISSPATLPTQMAAAENAVRHAADDLDSLKPPKDAEADNHTIVVALRTLQTQLGKLRAAANKHDIAALQAAAAALQASPEIRAGLQAGIDLKKKGYKVGALAETG